MEMMAMSNSSLVTFTKISPNKTSPRNHAIDTITIHCMAGDLSIETCGNLFARSSTKASSNYGIGSDGRIGMYVEEKDRSWATSNRANDMRAVTIEVASGSKDPYKVSDKAYKALIKLVTDICKRNGIKKLVWSTNKNIRVNHLNGANMTVHRDYANKACPGDYLYKLHDLIANEVNENLKSKKKDDNKYTHSQFIKDVCSILGVKDAKSALPKTVTISKTSNSSHKLVTPLERYMKSLGYYTGSIEADNGGTPSFGSGMESAIKKYQKNVVKASPANQDGVVTAKHATWKKLLGL